MKNKFPLVVFISLILFIVIFFVGNIKYSYKENKLYNQNDIHDYNDTKDEGTSLINRNEAVKIATYILKDTLKVNMDSKNSQIYINIYKGGINNEDYNWNISWYKNNSSDNYGVEINSNTGEINDIYINQAVNYKDKNNILSDEEIISLVNKLTDALGLNLNDYNLSTKSIKDYNINRVQTDYKVCTFVNKTDPSDKFVITIDCKGKFITNYRRNPNKEVK